MLSEIATEELVRFAIGAIQAYKFTNNEDVVGKKIAEEAKAGATMAQISESLRNMNVAAEDDAQSAIEKKRAEG